MHPPVNDRFCPDENLTRGQMAALLNRALDLTPSAVDRFVDDDDSVFEADIQALAAAGITLGCNPPVHDRFCPGDTVTRGQMAAFLNRAFGPQARSQIRPVSGNSHSRQRTVTGPCRRRAHGGVASTAMVDVSRR